MMLSNIPEPTVADIMTIVLELSAFTGSVFKPAPEKRQED